MLANNEFSSVGWSFPVSFTQNGKEVTMVTGTKDIEQSLHILFTTEVLERNMHPDFGCELQQFLYEEITPSLLIRMQEVIKQAILLHEPRIDVEDVTIVPDQQRNEVLLINLTYQICATNLRFNKVIPFYTQGPLVRSI